MKFALGENPKSVYNDRDEAPVTRMAIASLIREGLQKAKLYSERLQRFEEHPDEEEPPEYDAKCEALLRRAGGTVCDDRLVCGAITVDTRRLICTVDGKELDLPPKQFAILLYLMRHPGWTVSRETLLDRVWGMDYFGSDRVVDTHIKKLRRALGPAGAQIRTLVGRGYRMTEG
jgi:hypothetical protein